MKFFASLRGPKKGASLHVPQKRDPYRNRCLFQEPYLACPLGSPVKEPSLQVPAERDAPLLEPSFIHLSKSPVYEPPSTFPG